MRTRTFALRESEVNELQGAYHNCTNAQTKIRLQAVRLYGQGCSVKDIESICGCSRGSLMEWRRSYQSHGVTGLYDQRKGGNHAILDTYSPEQLWGGGHGSGDGQFWSVRDLARLVEERCGVVYQSDNSYRDLFRRCGFSRQRPNHYYKSRSEQAVVIFEEELEKN